MNAQTRKAVGYLRVSSNGQAENGVSLDAQRDLIKGWCRARGFDLLDFHVDAGISGAKTRNRPGLQQALKTACDQQAALVVYSLSRLARSTRDAIDIAEKLDKADGDLVSLSEDINTTTASGKMIFRLLSVLNEFESDLASERTRAALAHIRKQGRKTGGPVPYGLKLRADGILVEHKAEQRSIDLMHALRIDGCSFQEIVDELAARNVASKTGGTWSKKMVRQILIRTSTE